MHARNASTTPSSVTTATAGGDQSIKVALRIRNTPTWQGRTRPTSPPALSDQSHCIKMAHSATELYIENSVIITDPDNRKASKTFQFDAVFGPAAEQEDLYNAIVAPQISKMLEGYNGCIFAYGQTASGKTYSMQGSADALDSNADFKNKGIIPRVARQISDYVSHSRSTVDAQGYITECWVKASYLEIYNEQLLDLLKPKALSHELKIRMDPESMSGRDLFVEGLSEVPIIAYDDYMEVIRLGTKSRTVGETNMNEVSSRSHAILTLIIDQVLTKPNSLEEPKDSTKPPAFSKDGPALRRKRSKIHLIDLAGSERADSTGATGSRLKEGAAINLSLSALGNVISALTTAGTRHIPYRDSKLTYLLSDSLGGNALSLMLACVTPTSKNYQESLSTLRFAERVKKVVNKAVINVDHNVLKIMELEQEITSLREELKSLKDRPANKDDGKRLPSVDAGVQTDPIRLDLSFSWRRKWSRWLGICSQGARIDAVIDSHVIRKD